jgi:murein DD-endopeptidase MepM/ murein hydrolase activator NlpD
LVRPGDAVARGQQIGNIGHTGRATGPHLHWQMNWFSVRLDPSLSARTPLPEKS